MLALSIITPLTSCSADSNANLAACKKLAGYWNDAFAEDGTFDEAMRAQRNMRTLGESTSTELGKHLVRVVQAWESDGDIADGAADLQAIGRTCGDVGIDIPIE